MKIDRLVVSPFEMNCFILSCEKTLEAAIIDAGFEADRILSFIEQKGYRLKYLINTHAHVDHVSAVAEIKKRTGAPFLMHEGELPVMAGLIASQTVYQFGDHQVPEVDEYLSPDKVLELGELRIKVMETPGHSPGGVCFIVNDAVFTGDSLFDGSIGRTDLPGGSMPTLMDSIKTRILSLDDAFKVYPGHGPFTTIGKERQSNPFLTGDGFF